MHHVLKDYLSFVVDGCLPQPLSVIRELDKGSTCWLLPSILIITIASMRYQECQDCYRVLRARSLDICERKQQEIVAGPSSQNEPTCSLIYA